MSRGYSYGMFTEGNAKEKENLRFVIYELEQRLKARSNIQGSFAGADRTYIELAGKVDPEH